MAQKKSTRKPTKKNKTIGIVSAVVAVLLIAAIIVIAVVSAGKKNEVPADTDTAPAETAPIKVDTTADTTPTETEPVDVVKVPAHASNIKITSDPDGKKYEYVNPLTGEELSSDIVGKRPVAIMINNIRTACPQEGVSKADILYEILAEGGITRLLMVSKDYSALDVVGSIRSSRKYFIDMAQNHDAIYVHAGGSEEAYAEIPRRNIDHLDGVRSDSRTGKNLTSTCYYRDAWRRNNMGYEHSLMSTGELITKGIEIMGYRTDLKQDYQYPVNVIDYSNKVELDGNSGKYVKMTYRPAHYPEYEYDEATGKYLRFQFQHEKHIDNATKEQISFTNVIVLVMKHTNTGDEKNHINVQTTGSGNGYYFTGGKYIPINWSKADADAPIKLTDSEGNVLLINKGKTAVNVISPSIESSMVIN